MIKSELTNILINFDWFDLLNKVLVEKQHFYSKFLIE